MMQGLIIDTSNNFRSIPGLKHWLSSRFGLTIFNDGVRDRVSMWQDLSANSRQFNSFGNAYAPVKGSNYVSFNPGLPGSARHVMGLSSGLQDYKPIWNKPSKHGIYTIFNDVTGQTSSSPQFLQILLATTGGGGNFYNMYHNREGVGDPDSRFYTLRRYDGVNNLIQSGYLFQWQNEITSTATLVTAESSNNLKFYVNDSLGYQATINNTAPGVDPLVTEVYAAYQTDTSNELRLYEQIVYDWSAFTDAEAVAFDATVRGLLEQTKLELI